MGEEEGQQSTGSKVAGTLFHVLTGFWMVIAYCGWAISLAGLAALQNYVNSDANNAGPNGWSIPANYPSLSAGARDHWYLTAALTASSDVFLWLSWMLWEGRLETFVGCMDVYILTYFSFFVGNMNALDLSTDQ